VGVPRRSSGLRSAPPRVPRSRGRSPPRIGAGIPADFGACMQMKRGGRKVSSEGQGERRAKRGARGEGRGVVGEGRGGGGVGAGGVRRRGREWGEIEEETQKGREAGNQCCRAMIAACNRAVRKARGCMERERGITA